LAEGWRRIDRMDSSPFRSIRRRPHFRRNDLENEPDISATLDVSLRRSAVFGKRAANLHLEATIFCHFWRFCRFRDIAAYCSAIIAVLPDGLLRTALEDCLACNGSEISRFSKSVPAAENFYWLLIAN
jgi:hypothetical protein